MADDFQVGDVVVCVRDKPLGKMTDMAKPYWAALKVGALYRVASLVRDASGKRGVTLRGIDNGRWPGWDNDLFRKLPPASDGFTRRIRACLPHKVEEPA